MTLTDTLRLGRRAAAILEAPPLDPDTGYTDDEIAAQYAATDRLLAAFRRLEQLHTPRTEGDT